MPSRLSLWFSLINAVVVLLSDLHVADGSLSLQIIPKGQHLVLFGSTVVVSCRFSRRTASVHAQWHIDGTLYSDPSTFPQGIELAFSNTSAAQLRIHNFRRDLDQTEIKCSVLESPTSGIVESDTLTLRGTDVLPSSSTATTMVSTTTAPTATKPTVTATTPQPTSDPTTTPPTVNQMNRATEGNAAALQSSATRLVVFVSLIVSLIFSFVSQHNVLF